MSPPNSYYGALYEINPTDHEDWYKFYAQSGQKIYLYIYPPNNVNFDLQLYNPSGTLKSGSYNGRSSGETISFSADSTGYWRARIYLVDGEGQYYFYPNVDWPPPPPPPGGGGCPYVSTWDGRSYVQDNNLMPAAETSGGSDVDDYYRLEQQLVPTRQGKAFTTYSLRICEFENEHDYLDNTQLIAVDHKPDVNIAVTPNGEILTYRTPSPPLSCVDNYGNDRLNEVSTIDGDVSNPTTYFQGYKDDFLILKFERPNSGIAKLILRDDQKCTNDLCIEVQILDASSNWQTVEVLHPRAFWGVEAIDLTRFIRQEDEALMVRLHWTAPHRLDFVGLDSTPQADFKINYGRLITAEHSTEGNVIDKIIRNDQKYAELLPGQLIDLTYLLPTERDCERTFILYTNGYYKTMG